MAEGAPDYVHLRQILARDALGNLVPVACDPSGRIILLPYGTQTVSQDDPTRTIQGADGLTLHTIAVDDAGRLIMLPYGWDGATYRPIKVDEDGRMIGVMKGQADVKWGLRGWWKFVASEGTTIKDYSGYDNNGSALSGVGAEAKYEDGVIGEALEFDGEDDYVTVNDNDNLDMTDAITLESWIYIKDIEQVHQSIITKRPAVNEGNYSIRVQSRYLRFLFYNAEWISLLDNTTELNADTWYHIVATYDREYIRLYINSNNIKSIVEDRAMIPNAGTLRIGNREYDEGGNFDGYLDEVRIYNRALSQDEINWRYANTNPVGGKPTRMIAVDSEGRMEVNLKDLPYKDQVLERVAQINAGAGNYNLQSSVVPQGKVWMVTACNAYLDTAAIDSIDIGIYDGVDNVILAYERSAGAVWSAQIQTLLCLKAGDRLNAAFVGCPVNNVLVLNLNGYELDAP